MGPVLVLVARDGEGEILRAGLSLLTLARRLGSPVAVLCGEADAATLGVLGFYGAARVITSTPETGDGHPSEHAANLLVEAAQRVDPSAILIGSGCAGREVAARVAVRLDSGVITDAVDLVPGPGGPVAVREAFTASYLVGSVVRRGTPVITVRADAAVPEPAPVREPVRVESVSAAATVRGAVRIVSRAPKPAAHRPDLATAAVVVAGGRGVGSAAGFELLGRVADALGGAVGGSHAAADLGWCPPDVRIDQTGATVCPRLYLACGISGSVRHRAGMQDSRTIVAIDKDPGAPIFRIADFGVVGDLREVLPALLAEIARRRGAAPADGTEHDDLAAGTAAANPGTLDHAEA